MNKFFWIVFGIMFLATNGAFAENNAVCFVQPKNKDTAYNFIVYPVQLDYDNTTIPGEKNLANLSKKKWGIHIGMFFGKKFEGHEKIYGALLINTDEFDNFKPSQLELIGNGCCVELLSVENGWLFKYNLWVKRDDRGIKKLSPDFGKRIPLYVTNKIDISYQPWADKDGNVFFKSEKFYKWSSKTEAIESLDETPKRSINSIPYTLTGQINAKNTVTKIIVKSGNLTFDMNTDVIVAPQDPLAADDEILKGPFKFLGAENSPINSGDYDRMKQGLFRPGEVLALSNRLAKKEHIYFDQVLSKEEQNNFENLIKENKVAYDKTKNMIRELKKVQREKGALSILKKWLTDIEIKALMTAFIDPVGGGGVFNKGKTPGKRDKNKIVYIKNGQVIIPWRYYRILKKAIIKKHLDDSSQWENYSKDRASELKHAIQGYSKSVVAPDLKKYMESFLKVPEQKSWTTWFEVDNDDLNHELLFDYLASCSKKNLSSDFEKIGIKGIKQRRIMTIIDVYKKCNLYGFTFIENN